MRNLVHLLLAFTAFASFDRSCCAEIVIDQNWPNNSGGVWQFISQYVGEISDVKTTGKLVSITVPMQVAHLGSFQIPTLDWYILSVASGHPVAILATGTINDSDIDPTATIDLSNANLNFVSGDQFAFAFQGHTSQYSWYSYYGTDAPFHRNFTGNGSSWFIEPDYYNPTYIGAFTSYFEVIPEPSTLALLTLGGLGLLMRRRR